MSIYEIAHPARIPRAGFDATVAQDESGTHTTIAAALASGAASILVRNGTYVQAGDLVVPPYVFLVGETLGRVVVHFGGGPYSLKIQGPSFGAANPGTVSVTTGSSTVVGDGTTFTTTLAPGYVIHVKGVPYTVAAVADDTHLTIATPYLGRPYTGSAYVAGVPAGADILLNLVVAGSSTYGVQLLGIRDSGLSQVLVTGCAGGFLLSDCSIVFVRNSLVRYCAGTGAQFTNCSNCKFTESAVDSVGGVGVGISGCRLLTVAESRVRQCGSHGVTVAGSEDVHLQDTVLTGLVGDGIQVDAASTVSALSNCTVRACATGLLAAGPVVTEGCLFDSNVNGLDVTDDCDILNTAVVCVGATGTAVRLRGARNNVHGCRLVGGAVSVDATGATSVSYIGNRLQDVTSARVPADAFTVEVGNIG